LRISTGSTSVASASTRTIPDLFEEQIGERADVVAAEGVPDQDVRAVDVRGMERVVQFAGDALGRARQRAWFAETRACAIVAARSCERADPRLHLGPRGRPVGEAALEDDRRRARADAVEVQPGAIAGRRHQTRVRVHLVARRPERDRREGQHRCTDEPCDAVPHLNLPVLECSNPFRAKAALRPRKTADGAQPATFACP
jgi:hypothetical protein